MYMKSEILSLLLQWCQTVCTIYNVEVQDFGKSFSDGRALSVSVLHMLKLQVVLRILFYLSNTDVLPRLYCTITHRNSWILPAYPRKLRIPALTIFRMIGMCMMFVRRKLSLVMPGQPPSGTYLRIPCLVNEI